MTLWRHWTLHENVHVFLLLFFLGGGRGGSFTDSRHRKTLIIFLVWVFVTLTLVDVYQNVLPVLRVPQIKQFDTLQSVVEAIKTFTTIQPSHKSFRDWSWNNFYGHSFSLPLIQEGWLSVTGWQVVRNGTSCSSLGTQTYGVELGLVDPVSG